MYALTISFRLKIKQFWKCVRTPCVFIFTKHTPYIQSILDYILATICLGWDKIRTMAGKLIILLQAFLNDDWFTLIFIFQLITTSTTSCIIYLIYTKHITWNSWNNSVYLIAIKYYNSNTFKLVFRTISGSLFIYFI